MRDNKALEAAIDKAFNREVYKSISVGYGLDCIHCKIRDCKLVFPGKYKCMSCFTEFSFVDWFIYRTVTLKFPRYGTNPAPQS